MQRACLLFITPSPRVSRARIACKGAYKLFHLNSWKSNRSHSCFHLPCALRSYAGLARPRRSSSAPRSWRTGPSSWCIRHCVDPPSDCTPHRSAMPVRPGMRGSHTSPPHYYRKTFRTRGTSDAEGNKRCFEETRVRMRFQTGIYLANLCWLRTSTFPLISATILLLSSARPCSKTCWMT